MSKSVIDQYMELRKGLKKEVDSAVGKVLGRTGLLVVRSAKERLRKNKKYASSRLIGSITSEALQEGDNHTLKVGAYAKEKKYPYPAVVEFGRRRGSTPPYSAIALWLERKIALGHISLHLPENNTSRQSQIKSVAFAVARSIGEKGVKPFPFLLPAWFRLTKKVPKKIAKELGKIIDKVDNG